MGAVTLFGLGLQGKSATATAQKRINVYYEIQKDGDKNTLVIYGSPGLTQFVDLGGSPVRGWIAVNNLLYVVQANQFREINNAGTVTNRGTITTSSGRVDMTHNGTQVLIVDGTAGYTYTIATTTLATIGDADFPNGATTCAFIDGYFAVEKANSGRFYISDSYDGTVWDALDFANAESSPDSLVRVFVDHGELHLFGEFTTEFWANSGASDFPLTPIKAATVEWGLAAKWSLAKLGTGMIFLGRSRLGQVQVVRMVGYQCEAIQDQEFDSIINGYSTVTDATAFSFLMGGHEFYQINFPSAGKSWRYDVSTMAWSEVSSSGGRHLAEMQVNFLGKPYVADYSNGKVYLLDATAYTDNGTAIIRTVQSRHFFKGVDRLIANKLELQFDAGNGLASGTGSDPQVMLQLSKDGGKTWGNEMWRSIGQIGQYKARAVWRRLGISRDTVFRVKFSDPVPFVLVLADVVADGLGT